MFLSPRFFPAQRFVLAGTLLAVTALPCSRAAFAQDVFVRSAPPNDGPDAAPPRRAVGSPLVLSASAPLPESDRLRQLLQRPEVQNHLKLTVRQKGELGLNPKPSANGAAGRNAPPAGDDLPGSSGRIALVLPAEAGESGASPDERQKQAEAALEKLRAQLAADAGSRLGKIKEVLTPDQYARLLQLDLQRRGPLALGDPVVAEQIKLDLAKRAPVAALANDAQKRIGEATSEALRKSLGEPEAGSGDVRIVAPARLEQFRRDMKNRLSPVRQKTDKIKKEGEANVLALLSDEEQTRWREAQGEPFSFRKDR